MAFIETNSILVAWIAALTALTTPTSLQLESGNFFTLESGAALGLETAQLMFEDVNVFATKNLVDALKTTLTFDDRVCFLIPTAEESTTERSGTTYRTTRISEITMIMADRDYGDREAALIGSDTTMGVIALKDRMYAEFTHKSLGIPGILLEPSVGESFLFSDPERKKLKGREGWAIQWRTEAGTTSTTVSRFSS